MFEEMTRYCTIHMQGLYLSNRNQLIVPEFLLRSCVCFLDLSLQILLSKALSTTPHPHHVPHFYPGFVDKLLAEFKRNLYDSVCVYIYGCYFKSLDEILSM